MHSRRFSLILSQNCEVILPSYYIDVFSIVREFQIFFFIICNLKLAPSKRSRTYRGSWRHGRSINSSLSANQVNLQFSWNGQKASRDSQKELCLPDNFWTEYAKFYHSAMVHIQYFVSKNLDSGSCVRKDRSRKLRKASFPLAPF